MARRALAKTRPKQFYAFARVVRPASAVGQAWHSIVQVSFKPGGSLFSRWRAALRAGTLLVDDAWNILRLATKFAL